MTLVALFLPSGLCEVLPEPDYPPIGRSVHQPDLELSLVLSNIGFETGDELLFALLEFDLDFGVAGFLQLIPVLIGLPLGAHFLLILIEVQEPRG